PSPPPIHTLSLHDALPIFKVTVIATGFDSATKGFLNTRGEQLSSGNARTASSSVSVPFRPFAPKEIAAQHEVAAEAPAPPQVGRSEEHTSELQSPCNLVCR